MAITNTITDCRLRRRGYSIGPRTHWLRLEDWPTRSPRRRRGACPTIYNHMQNIQAFLKQIHVPAIAMHPEHNKSIPRSYMKEMKEFFYAIQKATKAL